MKNYTLEELSQVEAETDTKVLVVVNGKVYDLSNSKKWAGGRHMGRHDAGKDLTAEISAAPHGLEVLERFDMVGTYREPEKDREPGLKFAINFWLDRHPFFRRHPHPAIVHVPVGVSVLLPVFEGAALLTKSPATEWAAFLCLVVVLLSIPAAMASGYFTWWINYQTADSPTIRWKRRLAWIGLSLALLAVLWRGLLLEDPLRLPDVQVIIYAVGLLALAVVMVVIGYLGGTLTFPYEKSWASQIR